MIKASKFILKQAVKIYQIAISPFLGQHCRFFPRCSDYAQIAIEEKGVLKGSWLTLIRVGKCQPFHPGGVDPVES